METWLWDILSHYTPTQQSCWGVYWFHSVRPSVLLSIHLSQIPCPLCSTHSSGWIHFIFIYLIKQIQKVRRVESLSRIHKILIFRNFVKFVTLNLSCFDLMWIIGMGNHGAVGAISERSRSSCSCYVYLIGNSMILTIGLHTKLIK